MPRTRASGSASRRLDAGGWGGPAQRVPPVAGPPAAHFPLGGYVDETPWRREERGAARPRLPRLPAHRLSRPPRTSFGGPTELFTEQQPPSGSGIQTGQLAQASTKRDVSEPRRIGLAEPVVQVGVLHVFD